MKNNVNNKREERKKKYKVSEQDIKKLDSLYVYDHSDDKKGRREVVIERLTGKNSREIERLFKYMRDRNDSLIRGLKYISKDQTITSKDFKRVIEVFGFFIEQYQIINYEKFGKDYTDKTIKDITELQDKFLSILNRLDVLFDEEIKDIVPLFIEYNG